MCPAEEPGEVSAFIGFLQKSPAFGLPFKEMRGFYVGNFSRSPL